MKLLHRTIYPEVSVQDEKTGVCQYIASDESLDRQMEIIRADGWKFDEMEKNAPFVDSHRYGSVEFQLGKVLGGEVQGRKLVETVQWAIDVPQNRLAQLGWAMTSAGYLKAVSVGFRPTKLITRRPMDQYDGDWMGCECINAATRPGKAAWQEQAQYLGQDLSKVETVYVEQMQHELSACILGANPNALAKSWSACAKAYKAGLLKDDDLEFLSTEYAKRETASLTVVPAEVKEARQRAQTAFLVGMESRIKRF